MKQRIGSVLLALGLAILSASAQTTVLNFDNLNPGVSVIPMPAGYGGLNWAANIGIWGASQPPFNPQSAPNRALFNLSSESGVAESLVTFIAGPKVFDGAYFSGYFNVQFNLYSGATLVATSSLLNLGASGSGPTFLASGYAGPVTTVGIVGDRGLFSMDNFTFEAVPEPSTLSLSVIGIVALGLGCRQRVHHSPA
jgi:hypothetical protein